MKTDFKFYDDDVLVEVRSENKKFWNGFLILFDIVDSTKRKKEQPALWYEHTASFYKAVHKFGEKLLQHIQNDFHSTLSLLDENDRTVVIKFGGDSGIIFLPTSYKASPKIDENPCPDLCQNILKVSNAFIKDSHKQNDLGHIKLKSVVTYLTGLRSVRFDSGIISDNSNGMPKLDILGRGIDFTFRLEKFASPHYTVINKLLGEQLIKNKENEMSDDYPMINIENEEHFLIECRKKVKGWDNPEGEKFYLLISEMSDEEKIPQFSPQKEDVDAELFKFQLSDKNTKNNLGTKDKAENELADSPSDDILQDGNGSD